MPAAAVNCDRSPEVSLRCLIVDDNASFRDEARGLLQEQGFDVVGTAGSVADARQQVAGQRPDVVLIDIDLGDENGLDLARLLLDDTAVAPKMILISARDESEYGDLIETSPAVGFLAKTDLTAAAIRRLLARADDP